MSVARYWPLTVTELRMVLSRACIAERKRIRIACGRLQWSAGCERK